MGLPACAAFQAGSAGGSHGRIALRLFVLGLFVLGLFVLGRIALGLFLLGLGWSAGLVSGSALLTDSVPQPARAAAQGLPDPTMNTSAGIGGAVAGPVVAWASYGRLNLTAACLLIPLAAPALVTRSRKAPVSDGPRRVAGKPSR